MSSGFKRSFKKCINFVNEIKMIELWGRKGRKRIISRRFCRVEI